MEKEREIQLDVIKVMASLMVITLHLGNIYLRSGYFIDKPVYQWIGHFWSITMRLCVPMFVMVSGSLFFRNKEKLKLASYYKNTLKRIVAPTIIASGFYTFVTGIQQYIFSSGIKFDVLLENIYTGNVYSHLWYMYMAIGLYLMAPILHNVYCKVNKGEFCLIGLGLTGIGVISAFLFDLPWPLLFIQYMGYFVMGRVLRELDVRISKNYLLIIGGCIWVGVYILSVMQRIYHFYENVQLYKYLSPFTILTSWILYYLMTSCEFKRMTVSLKKHIVTLSSANLWIYLVHQFFLDIVYHWILRDNSVLLHPALFIPVMSIAIYCVSFFTTRLLRRSKKGSI